LAHSIFVPFHLGQGWSATFPLATGQILGRFALDPQATPQKENLSLAVLEIKNLSSAHAILLCEAEKAGL